jgi:hypothetical protein
MLLGWLLAWTTALLAVGLSSYGLGGALATAEGGHRFTDQFLLVHRDTAEAS